jgi:hypothetical protein
MRYVVGLTLKLRKSLLLPELSIHESTKRLIQHNIVPNELTCLCWMNLSISVTNHLSSSCMCTKGCFAFADVGDCVSGGITNQIPFVLQ